MASADSRRRFRAPGALALLDPGHDAVVAVLLDALGSPEATVRRHGAHALALCGAVATAAAPDPVASLAHSDWSERADAAVALSALGTQGARQALAAYGVE